MAGSRWSHGQSSAGKGWVGWNPTDRGKRGRKRSLLVDWRGVPLSIAVSGANVPASKLLGRTLAQVVVQRPQATSSNQQYLCLDAGYVGYPVSKIARQHRIPPSKATLFMGLPA